MKEFHPSSLKEFNGSDKSKPIYVARDNKVYDVSKSKLWSTGLHMNRHQAGQDHTSELSAAPHGDEVFERVPQVGVLYETNDAASHQVPKWLLPLFSQFPSLRRHPHPMLVHFPIAFMIATAIFILLALITGNKSFETTALHCLASGLIFTPLAIATGIFTWWFNYGGRSMKQVQIKIWGSLFLMLDASILFAWRLFVPDILINWQVSSYIYLLLAICLIPLVSVIGWFGAQLTFPD